ncbi:sodium/potassium-transporting ATPase subunit beta-2, putative [Pediculus humanus corporis]|uniref:Sodium/potassium-transporting ATPase subunit beta-2, putative n=1 Tax=Pediculus humanus subsp. corporis TaxID=121224 RepID=E0VS44_PEDHC|nr:sodium/potassium-transporting ATPase subunit beta-2, putative [Pediculus humanus corporis]EEB16200.1 sodium/potassium-transporting ATPase subunit beta-2, putative [Pediculus humanus corporis]
MAEKTQCKDAVPYLRPPKKSFKHFFYHHETKAIFGRTGSSWAKISLFYFVFYIVLAAMFTIMLWVFFQTLNTQEPRWKLEQSLIGTNPGMGFRPHPPGENVESTLIWYNGSDRQNFQYWINSLNEFLEVYRHPGLTPGRGQNIYNCDYDRPPNSNQVCNVDVKNWHPCTKENSFNYHKSGPCIFLKLNKIYGWKPDYYNDTDNLPESMPTDLKEHIALQKAMDSKLLNTIWVSCQGENPLDRENIGPVHYIPRNRGFPGYFYPFENNEGYLSPLLAIHLERPKTGILINIECKAWAKNIIHNQKEKLGSVHIELQID